MEQHIFTYTKKLPECCFEKLMRTFLKLKLYNNKEFALFSPFCGVQKYTFAHYGSFTLAIFVSETVSDSDM
jgi:hypothetical protein